MDQIEKLLENYPKEIRQIILSYYFKSEWYTEAHPTISCILYGDCVGLESLLKGRFKDNDPRLGLNLSTVKEFLHFVSKSKFVSGTLDVIIQEIPPIYLPEVHMMRLYIGDGNRERAIRIANDMKPDSMFLDREFRHMVSDNPWMINDILIPAIQRSEKVPLHEIFAIHYPCRVEYRETLSKLIRVIHEKSKKTHYSMIEIAERIDDVEFLRKIFVTGYDPSDFQRYCDYGSIKLVQRAIPYVDGKFTSRYFEIACLLDRYNVLDYTNQICHIAKWSEEKKDPRYTEMIMRIPLKYMVQEARGCARIIIMADIMKHVYQRKLSDATERGAMDPSKLSALSDFIGHIDFVSEVIQN
jgi:hypothetical protein